MTHHSVHKPGPCCCAVSCCGVLYRIDIRADTLRIQGVCSSLEWWPPAVTLLQRPGSSPLEAHQSQLGLQGQTGSCRSSSRSKQGQDRNVCLLGRPAGAVSASLQLRWFGFLRSVFGSHACCSESSSEVAAPEEPLLGDMEGQGGPCGGC